MQCLVQLLGVFHGPVMMHAESFPRVCSWRFLLYGLLPGSGKARKLGPGVASSYATAFGPPSQFFVTLDQYRMAWLCCVWASYIYIPELLSEHQYKVLIHKVVKGPIYLPLCSTILHHKSWTNTHIHAHTHTLIATHKPNLLVMWDHRVYE